MATCTEGHVSELRQDQGTWSVLTSIPNLTIALVCYINTALSGLFFVYSIRGFTSMHTFAVYKPTCIMWVS